MVGAPFGPDTSQVQSTAGFKEAFVSQERRLEPRYALNVPIRIGAVEATTLNVSLSGVSFVSPVAFPVSKPIAFSVVLRSASTPVQMDCRGVVTRADPGEGGFVVAATIDQFRIASEQSLVLSA
jgi:PilZ domain-containing protein